MTDENALAGQLALPDLVFRTWDAPTARGRKPRAGEQQWSYQFHLEDGTHLRIVCGPECRDAFRRFILQEEADDAVERLLRERERS